jgi:hypothetical protein
MGTEKKLLFPYRKAEKHNFEDLTLKDLFPSIHGADSNVARPSLLE